AVVDWHLPGITGGEVCSSYRQRGGQAAIIMLTNRDKTTQKVEGLELGADDYLTKPFDCNELMARVRALLRRPPVMVSKRIEKTGVQLDYQSCSVSLNGKTSKLLPKEFEVLEFLLKHSGHYFSADDLLKHLWSSESEVGPEAIRVCISRIRSKVDQKEHPSLIETSKGWGYKISDSYLTKAPPADE
ncbi:MAG: response regulator transcription factor, partial [Cyanobacteria bacterium]|nr:response regulator transcription factor [Cyanobacteriota bacterium]